MERYARNCILTSAEQSDLLKKRVLIVGAGGLGGYILEMLVRIGIGEITLIDADVFEESNLNRQILSDINNIGEYKAAMGKNRAISINPEIKINEKIEKLTIENADEIVFGHDLVFDALDSIGDRMVLRQAAKKAGIPLVHGAIAGWLGQVTFVMPEDNTLEKIYPTNHNKGIEVQTGNPSFTPAVVAGFQVAEGIKYLTGKDGLLRNSLLTLDLLNHNYQIIEL